jgi:riboflavin synthase
MFTGLIEATGTVLRLEPRGNQAVLELAVPFAPELALGDSLAVNGCCLTVSACGSSSVSFDLLSQTLKMTSLGALAAGSHVNLERAMRASDRLGGHFVQGHVDATGTLLDLSPHGQDHRLEVSLPPAIQRYCLAQGSLAVDGISLTIAELGIESALFWITPHTFAHTHLHASRVGQSLNLEADLLAKYVERLLPRS